MTKKIVAVVSLDGQGKLVVQYGTLELMESNREATNEAAAQCVKNGGHYQDNQGFCHSCGILMNEENDVKPSSRENG